MEMEMQLDETTAAVLEQTTERLTLAAAALEAAAIRIATLDLEAAQSREATLEQQLQEAQATIAHLQASTGRKTQPVHLQAKEGATMEAGALDTALSCLSMEQRIAVKAQLLRSGFLG